MSASEKLRALEWSDGPFIDGGVGTHRVQRALELRNALPQIVAVVEAAERGELKLRSEYRGTWPTHSQVALDDLPEWEQTWAEGQRLADALADLEEAL